MSTTASTPSPITSETATARQELDQTGHRLDDLLINIRTINSRVSGEDEQEAPDKKHPSGLLGLIIYNNSVLSSIEDTLQYLIDNI